MSFCVFIGNDLPYFTLCDFLAIDHLFSSRPHDLKIYDVERLKWHTAYNARAGVEILLHYLQQYGVAEEKQTGHLDNAARATYAVYNAGPKAVTRYRARNSSAREKKVDTRFRKLYRGFAADGEVDLSRCTVERGAGKK